MSEREQKLREIVDDVRNDIEGMRNKITHPYGRRADFIDSTDQIRVDALTDTLDAIDRALIEMDALP